MKCEDSTAYCQCQNCGAITTVPAEESHLSWKSISNVVHHCFECGPSLDYTSIMVPVYPIKFIKIMVDLGHVEGDSL